MTLLAPPDAIDRLRAAMTAPADHAEVVELPPASFLMVDGLGPPDASAFAEAVHTIYGMTYGLRHALREAGADPGPMMPLEALWRSSTGETWNPEGPHEWNWTAMMSQSPLVTRDLLRQVREQVRRHRPGPGLNHVRLDTLYQGLVAQILHVGPYLAERGTIERLHAELHALGFRPDGPHHEIYLNEPTRTPPTGLRTILRQPIRRAD
jgi:hypothetical protein